MDLYEWACTNCGKEHQFADTKAPKECTDCHARCKLTEDGETADRRDTEHFAVW